MTYKKSLSIILFMLVFLYLCNYANAYDMIASVARAGLKASFFYQQEHIEKAVIKIYASNDPRRINSWFTPEEHRASGTGFITENNMILTNAHVVDNYQTIKLAKSGSLINYEAHIAFISRDLDLAILQVEDTDFYRDIKPLHISDVRTVRHKVKIFGYPGGNNLTVTDGALFQFAEINYLYGNRSSLAGRIVSDIKSGNSGGPVVMNGDVIGIVMQVARGKKNCFMVPGLIIKRFLKDFEVYSTKNKVNRTVRYADL
jgi:S1-C subfamily serine protease